MARLVQHIGSPRIRSVAIAVFVAAGVVLPFVAPNKFVLTVASLALIYAILAVSWDLLIGFAGLVSFGHAGFFGLGGYAAALITYHAGLSPWLGLPIGALAGGLLGVIIGVPTLKLRSVYLALATLAFSESLRIIATNWYSFTRGSLGFNLHTTIFRLSGEATSGYYVVLAVTVVSIGAIYVVARHTQFGMTLQAIRDDEMRARALGIDVVFYKVLAFAISGFFAGLAGALYTHYIGLISPSELGPTVTMLVVAMATIGGIGTILGPAFASLLIYFASELLRMVGATYGQVAIGGLLIFFVIVFPQGIAGWLARIRNTWLEIAK
jgi:branched-chain amino acid transport system permease protein